MFFLFIKCHDPSCVCVGRGGAVVYREGLITKIELSEEGGGGGGY